MWYWYVVVAVVSFTLGVLFMGLVAAGAQAERREGP